MTICDQLEDQVAAAGDDGQRSRRGAGNPADQIAEGDSSDVIDGRVAFQNGAEDEFKAAIERLTGRPVTAFLSANQTSPGIACELFFLEPVESAGGE